MTDSLHKLSSRLIWSLTCSKFNLRNNDISDRPMWSAVEAICVAHSTI